MTASTRLAATSSTQAMSNKWTILVVSAAITCVLIGGPVVSLGVYIPMLERVEGWPDTAIGGAGAALLVCMSLSGVVTGGLVDRFSPRISMFLGGVMAGAGCWLAALSAGPAPFIGSFALVGSGVGAAGLVPSIPVLSHAFGRNRGLALGAYFAAMSLAAASLPVLSSVLIGQFGWRSTLQMTGGAIALCSLAALALRLPSVAKHDEAGVHGEAMFGAGTTVAEAVRSPGFWMLLAALSLSLANVQGVLYAVVGFLVHGGMAAGEAVAIFSTTNLLAAPSLFLIGAVADRLGARRVLLVGAVLQAAGTLALLGALSNGVSGWLAIGAFAIFWGMTCGVPAQVGPMLLEDLVGPRRFGKLWGVTAAVTGVSAALAPLQTALLRNLSGGYVLVFCVYGAMCLSSAPLIMMIRPQFRQAVDAPRKERLSSS